MWEVSQTSGDNFLCVDHHTVCIHHGELKEAARYQREFLLKLLLEGADQKTSVYSVEYFLCVETNVLFRASAVGS